MPDQPALREALHDLVADVHADAALRRRIDRRPRRPLLLAAAAVLVVALVGAALVAVRDRKPSKVVSTPDSVQEGWRTLAPIPLSPRVGAAVVWADDQLVVWGGGTPTGQTVYDDGAVYDPKADEWHAMAKAPITGRMKPVAVWSGTELLVWSGSGGYGLPTGGAAYDPEHDRWRVLPDAPIDDRPYAEGVWTGTELVVWGGYSVDQRSSVGSADGAVYDPATDEWRTMPESPLSPRFYHRLTWTGSEVLIWGGATGDGGDGQDLDDGAGYDPATDTWNYLPSAPIAGRKDPVEVWTGDRLVVWGGYFGTRWLPDGAMFDPVTGQWDPIAPGLAGEERDGGAVGVWADGRLLTWPDRGAYDRDGNYWLPLPPAPVDDPFADVVWTGHDLLVVPTSTGGTVVAYRPPEHPALPRTGPTCGTTFDHLAPTYLPRGWSGAFEPGSADDSGEAAGHWSGPDGSIEVWPSPGPLAPREAGSERITVLDAGATLGDVGGGLAVRTGCGFDLVARGVSRDDLRMVAEGLVDGRTAFALWPDAAPSEAIGGAQRLAAGVDPWRADAVATAEHFVAEVLGWTDVQATSSEPGVVRVTHAGRTHQIWLARNVAARWWSVVNLRTFDGDDGGSAAFLGDRALLRTSAALQPFATSEARFWRGGVGASVTGTEPGGEVLFDPPRPTDVPGWMLLLLKDASGNVVDAWGFAIGAGEFAAG